MKCFILCILAAVVVAATAVEVTKESDCKCWEDYKPEKLETGDGFYCRGSKTKRIFDCGEEEPPICKCEQDNKEIELDLGETDCLTVDQHNGRWCKNKDEFIQYFRKHPEHAIYDK